MVAAAPLRRYGSGRPLVVVALGGNALMPPEDDGSLASQQKRCDIVARALYGIVRRGFRVLLVHGNGPQVGQEMLRGEATASKLPLVPLDGCVAATQGTMGVQLELALYNQSPALRVASLLTLVEVLADDPAFGHPTKPIGPFFAEHRAKELRRKHKWQIVEDSGRGWRKVVPSPLPVSVLNLDAIDAAVSRADVVIAGGGGGVPVLRGAQGKVAGVEAVIDKDATASLLGQCLGAQTLVILTGVDAVSLDFGKPTQRRIDSMTASQAETWWQEGQFPPGSMGPKVRACVDFVRASGQTAAVASVRSLAKVLIGRGGTRVEPDGARQGALGPTGRRT